MSYQLGPLSWEIFFLLSATLHSTSLQYVHDVSYQLGPRSWESSFNLIPNVLLQFHGHHKCYLDSILKLLRIGGDTANKVNSALTRTAMPRTALPRTSLLKAAMPRAALPSAQDSTEQCPGQHMPRTALNSAQDSTDQCPGQHCPVSRTALPEQHFLG